MKTFKMFAALFSSVILSNKIYFDLTSVIKEIMKVLEPQVSLDKSCFFSTTTS